MVPLLGRGDCICVKLWGLEKEDLKWLAAVRPSFLSFHKKPLTIDSAEEHVRVSPTLGSRTSLIVLWFGV